MAVKRRVSGQSRARPLIVATTATLVLVPIASTAHADSKSNATFTYSYCTAAVVDATYHPGEVIRLPWVATANVPSAVKSETVTLSEEISGPYETVASLKSAFARHTPRLGKFNAEANEIRISYGVATRTVELITIPSDATAGFYELTTSTVTRSIATSRRLGREEATDPPAIRGVGLRPCDRSYVEASARGLR
jgi:hypothetical protein